MLSQQDNEILTRVGPGSPTGEVLRRYWTPALLTMEVPDPGGCDLRRVSTALELQDAVTEAARGADVVVMAAAVADYRPADVSESKLKKDASDAGLTVFPGAIRGTRTMLRGDQWLPRRTAVTVDVGEPIRPTGTDFAAVLALRDQARAAMLARWGPRGLPGKSTIGPGVRATIAPMRLSA